MTLPEALAAKARRTAATPVHRTMSTVRIHLVRFRSRMAAKTQVIK